MSEILKVALYGLAIGLCFPIGALITAMLRPGHKVIASAMSLGAGLLIAAALIDLAQSAQEVAGLDVTIAVIVFAATVFSVGNWVISKGGGARRKRCGGCVAQPTEEESPGSGKSIALGTVMDAIPEALVLGVALSGGGHAWALLVALALGNTAQSVSSTSGLIHADRGKGYLIKLWGGLTVAVIVTTLLSFIVFGQVGEDVRPWIEAFAAGVLIAMTCEAMLPEAFHENPSFRGLQTAIGIAGFMWLHSAL